jgi:hypothetical protein
MTKNEIVLFTSNDLSDFQIEVRLENDTVWLNRQQLSLLFGRDVKTIGKHITNVLKEELNNMSLSVVAKFAITAKDGKTYQVEHYNLDVIISVGYRVKSKRGIQFRIWANKVLKDFLLKGYAVDHRLDKVENDVYQIKNKLSKIDFQIQTSLPQNEGVFYNGQIFDAYGLISKVVKSAKESITLIDNYVDETVLTILSKRNKEVKATIYTSNFSKQLKLDLNKHNQQYPEIEIKHYIKSHDRFLIIDNKIVYHIGASLKDLGKKWFAFSRINIDAGEMLNRLQ